MNYLILINKDNGLGRGYIPDNLVKVKIKTGGNKKIFLEKQTYKQMKKLLKEMNKCFDTEIVIDSGYRPYLYQENLLKELLLEKGEEAYQCLALPGYSEHQSGLAVDIGFYNNGVYDSKFNIKDYLNEFKWLKENAYKYGFIVRYPEGKENITKYIYEPWHLRYIGKKAEFLTKHNLTLEEYYEMFVL